MKVTSAGFELALLLGMLLFPFAFHFPAVKSEPITWTVDDEGPADFTTIQAAIDNASLGDTIYVHE